ncbi:YdcF family protein [Curtobacterium pusillum]|uniref:YdcF family protein n=1 Tax=Curtobacterium pusillum TaxID=69373 RepID=UPI001643B61A|nr:YdcF family protein [Curtobacterium pusillum]
MTAAIVAWGEAVHAHAARRERQLPRAPRAPGAVVVLGFQNRGDRINVVNRWRARIAVRTAREAERRGASATIICSGGAAHGTLPEAELLAGYLRGSLGWSGPVLVESESTSTWENVRNVVPLLGDARWVAFASNGLYAEKARVYLRRQRPDLGRLLVRADDYRLGEMLFIKPVFAAVGLWKLRAVFHVERRRSST